MSDGADARYLLRPLESVDAASCVEVVRTLPEWFGYPGALESVETAARTQQGFVVEQAGAIIAFVTAKLSFTESLEITYLAVSRLHRGLGLGRRLVHEVAKDAHRKGCASIFLLTLGPSSDSPHYAETVDFYLALGFWRVKELHIEEWGGAPSLVMAAPVVDLAAGNRS